MSTMTFKRVDTTPHRHTHAPNRSAVLTTARRLDAHPDYAGHGVTIAFLDSGFQRHPDLVEPVDPGRGERLGTGFPSEGAADHR